MKKIDLIGLVSEKAKLSKKGAREAIDALLGEIRKALSKGDKVVISGFGTFKSGIHSEKTVLYPPSKNKGVREKKIVPKHRVVKFSAGRDLRKAVK